MLYPNKFKKGDEIRVIAPSDPAKIISKERIDFAAKRLEGLGFIVSYGVNLFKENPSETDKADDIHDAFLDKKVVGIFSMIGGQSSINVLPFINWDIIKKNPKIFCGYSDIDVLSIAIHTMVDMVTYSGVHFSTFSQEKHFEYTLEYFVKCLVSEESYDVFPSVRWSDDTWYLNQEKRDLIENDGFWLLQDGDVCGKVMGTNISSLLLLQKTKFAPILNKITLFLEKDDSWGKTTKTEFGRALGLVLEEMGSAHLGGLVFGRFTKNTEMTRQDLVAIINQYPQLRNIPIIGNVDFGHTDPKIVVPIGGEASLRVSNRQYKLTVIRH